MFQKYLCIPFAFFLVLFGYSLNAQSFHFSQFQMAPHILNPALAGNYVGTMRIGLLYRNQWSNFMSAYSSPTFYLDGPIGISFGKHDWLGAGGVVISDRAGAGGLSTGGFLFSGVYHKGFGNRGQNVISLGLQYGVMSRRVRNPQGLNFYDALEIGQGQQSVDLPNIQNDNQRNNKFVIGLTYTHKYDQEDRLQFGLSATNFLRRGNNVTLLSGGGGYFLRPHFIGFASLDKKITDEIIVRPFAQFQFTDRFFELVTIANFGYKLNRKEDITVNFGMGYRLGDSGIVTAGMDYKTLRVGLAYDVNLSSLGAANSFELGISYIIKIIKKPKVRPVIFCPRL
jgi:type IX secretion system PorP/SprF family membrane protein